MQETVRMATVTSVGTDGTVTVQRNDDVFPNVRVLSGYVPAVGDVVEIATTLGGFVCLGKLVDWDTSWQYPTINAPFFNRGGDYQLTRYRRTALGVEMQGLIDTAGQTGNAYIFAIPAEYRPAKNLVFPAKNNLGISQMNVYASGDVRMLAIDGAYLSISCQYTLD